MMQPSLKWVPQAPNRYTRSMFRPTILAAAWMVVAACSAPAQKTDSQSRSEAIIQQLDMRPLPKESGYWGVIGATAPIHDVNGRALAAQSATYSLLTQERPLRYLNRMQPIETDVLVEGGPVDVYTFCGQNQVDETTLGRDYANLQQGLVIVPANCWKAEMLHPGAEYALMVNLLSPEFTTDRVHAGAGPDWIHAYAGKAPWATPEFLRTLIGPNWQP
jgi:predicted cupin superfamily sugar epimerase